jgi:TPR repeat protein
MAIRWYKLAAEQGQVDAQYKADKLAKDSGARNDGTCD